MGKKICMIGAFDTKGKEFEFLYSEILRRGFEVLSINAGSIGTTSLFPVDVDADEVAVAGGGNIADIRSGERAVATRIMCDGAQKLVDKLYREGQIAGIIGMGGGGGTAVATLAMRNLPVGFPKVCVSTLASGNTSEFVGRQDIVMFPSIVDICGVNRFLRQIISRAAGAVCGMAEVDPPVVEADRPIVFISMFGSTTKCVEQCVALLDKAGYDSIVFHATGSGGRTLEELTLEGHPTAVLDITTTEWADELAGGVFTAGPSRLDAPGTMGLPHLIVPGCVDMVNFFSPDSVPQKYKETKRQFVEWTPMITLMRTNPDENRQIGEIFAKKANNAGGPVKFLIPRGGVSVLDAPGKPFYNPEANAAFSKALRENIAPGIEITDIDAHINDQEFSQRAVELLLSMIK